MTNAIHSIRPNPMGGATRRFTWNRTHTVFVVAFAAFLIIATLLTAINGTAGGGYAHASAAELPQWMTVALGVNGAGLAVANLLGGWQRTGSLSMPAASAGSAAAVLFAVELCMGLLGATASDMLTNVAVTVVWFALAAFVPYLIGHYGLRPLFAESAPDPATRTGRLALRLRRTPALTGCWIALIAVVALVIGVRYFDVYGFVFALSMMFVTPIALAAVCGIAGAASPHGWRVWLAGAIAQTALWLWVAGPLHTDGCPDYLVAKEGCVTLPNGWGLVLDLDLPTTTIYVIGPVVLWLAAWGIGALIRRRRDGRRAADGATRR